MAPSNAAPTLCLLSSLLFGCSPAPPPPPPAFHITSTPVATAQLGVPYQYAVLTTEPPGTPLSYALTTAPVGMQVDGSGLITWTPQAEGDNSVALSVVNQDGVESDQAYVLHVQCGVSAFPFAPSNVSASAVDFCQTADVSISGTDNTIDSENPANTTAFDSSTTQFQIQTQSDQSRVGVYFVKSLRVEAGAQVQVVGNLPLVIVARNDVTLLGSLLAPPGTAGGTAQGVADSTGIGLGGGQPGTATGPQLVAGSGGSYCGVGGAGAAEGAGGSGTSLGYGRPSMEPLRAGSSGGTGALPGYGAGGGAIQLTAGGTLSVLLGGAVLAPGGGGFEGGTNGQEAGGGGSGGAILLEGSAVTLSGTLVANGGGGGQGGGGDPGQDGQLIDAPAYGGRNSTNTSFGGNGSVGAVLNGSAGADQTGVSAGGGGGGAGRIRINARSGGVNFSSPTLSPSEGTACVSVGTGQTTLHTSNGVWLGYAHAETAAQAQPAVVSPLLQRLYGSYDVTYIFVNVGSVDGVGHIVGLPPHLQDFLASAVGWRSANQAALHLVAWVNAGTNPNSGGIDLSRPDFRAAVVAEARKLVSASEPGSYVAPGFEFDGVQMDFEPSGDDVTQPGRFEGFLSLMAELRAGFAAANRPQSLLSAIAPQLGTSSAWRWSANQYYAFAQSLDLLVWLAYDMQLTSSGAYEARVQQQATDILRAMYGEGLSPPQPHQPGGAALMVGLPAYPASANHDTSVENIPNGALALTAAVAAMQAAQDPAVGGLMGAAVYLQSDGTGNDGYASWDTDWAAFGQDWLGP